MGPARLLLQQTAQGDIFHQGLVREATGGSKEVAADKNTLVPGGNSCDPGTQIDHGADDPIEETPTAQTHIKAAPSGSWRHTCQ